jgi:hypothetical protein
MNLAGVATVTTLTPDGYVVAWDDANKVRLTMRRPDWEDPESDWEPPTVGMTFPYNTGEVALDT